MGKIDNIISKFFTLKITQLESNLTILNRYNLIFLNSFDKQKTPTKEKGFNVAPGGIEPPTHGFSVHCSTD